MRILKLSTPAVAGPDVAAWQRFLKTRAFLHGPIDGKFGHLTEISTKVYQKSVGLPNDGVVGQQTIERAKSDGYMLTTPLVSPLPSTHVHHENRSSFDTQRGVVLSTEMKTIIDAIAHDFLAQTGKRLMVTSGTRTAESQASAMKTKLDKKDDLLRLYRDQHAVTEIIQAYDCAAPSKQEQAMTKTIRDQMARGVFISRHLSGKGADFRDRDLSRTDKQILKDISEAQGLTIIVEGVPPHIHVQLDR